MEIFNKNNQRINLLKSAGKYFPQINADFKIADDGDF
ncbi:hypothetical protein J2Y47_002885 [Arcicella sp. BE51]|nr:hypothetical protein [Arcicella sp. BE51]